MSQQRQERRPGAAPVMPVGASTSEDSREIQGYKYANDTIANQMAYLFAGDEGEKRAKKIREEAQKQFPHELEILKRRKYIEDEVKKHAQEADQKFQTGFVNVFDDMIKNNPDPSQPWRGKLNGPMVGMMQSMGLNVDPDNVETFYEPGPPQIYGVIWVNRPSENLKNEQSEINQLADDYKNTFGPAEQSTFEGDWKRHVDNAQNGLPKMSPQEFKSSVEETISEVRQRYASPGQHGEAQRPSPSPRM